MFNNFMPATKSIRISCISSNLICYVFYGFCQSAISFLRRHAAPPDGPLIYLWPKLFPPSLCFSSGIRKLTKSSPLFRSDQHSDDPFQFTFRSTRPTYYEYCHGIYCCPLCCATVPQYSFIVPKKNERRTTVWRRNQCTFSFLIESLV